MKKVLAAAITCALISPLFAVSGKASDAVKQKIVVEKVDGLRDDFMKGVDISMVDQIERTGGKFYNARGEEEDIFKILKDHGVNYVRIRLWNNPTYEEDQYDKNGKLVAKKGEKRGGGDNTIETDLRIAKRIKAAGLQFMLDFHYSDFWADPGKQYMPQDWKNLSAKELENTVEKFTRETIDRFAAEGAAPDSVQIGNELNSGFMWPIGQTWSEDPKAKIGGMKQFMRLLDRASKGVRSAKGGNDIKIIIHLADGGKQDLYKYVFDEVKKAKIDYDIIGLSFYPYWHGSIAELTANLEMISKRYGKEMAVVETAYAFTEENGDFQGNVFQVYSDEANGYVPSVQGQATELRDIIAAVSSVKGGCGVFWWEADSILWKGANLSATEGNTWENQALFDFTGKVLPSMAVWNLVSGKGEVENVWGGSAKNGSGFTPYALADSLEITAKTGETPALPSKIKVIYTNDSEGLVDVKWESIDWKNQKAGIVSVEGTVSGQSFKARASVVLSNRMNLIEDPSFESGKMGKWKLNGPGAACFMENNKGNAKSGKWTYKYWLGNGFKSVLSQTVSVPENGTYELSVWAMGGGGENNIRLFAANFDGTEKQVTSKITNTGWTDWHQYKIRVPVSNGKVTVGIYLDTNPDCWGNFDDIELIKVD
ncbi:glycosyl hydrolase 53 family protein [uncultured Treponema sp.]|uniref:glycosyl hydrolase 53 family protein n=1 Tax=uncultured Treponema sp. TaxID=162155 RepID=UPI0025D9C32F|nr:glycosyl hydrolase 53 family protein [uncultured Treponema sp.]